MQVSLPEGASCPGCALEMMGPPTISATGFPHDGLYHRTKRRMCFCENRGTSFKKPARPFREAHYKELTAVDGRLSYCDNGGRRSLQQNVLPK